MMLSQLGKYSCFYYREDGRGPASPSGRRGSSEIHLHRPWKQVAGTKNPWWVKEEEDDAAEESTSERIRVFTLVKRALFISMC
jgi:hypothetical protein